MWSRGSLDHGGVRPVALRISAQGATGTLTVQGKDDVLAVRFRGGEIVGADALREAFQEGLGRILVEKELMSPAQVSEVASAELHTSIVDHLSESGLVDAENLSLSVREHLFRLLRGLLSWSSGEFQFYEGEVSWNRAVQPLSVEELLVRASEVDPELFGGRIGEIGVQTLRPALQRSSYSVLSWDEGDARDGEGVVWLTPLEDALLRSLDGVSPTVEYREVLGIDDYRLRFALHRLRALSLVEPVSAPEADPEPAPIAEMQTPIPVPAKIPGPDPLARQMRSRGSGLSELRALLSDLSRGFSLVLAAGLALLLLGTVVLGGGSPLVHHPLPWQVEERAEIQGLRAMAGYRNLSSRLATHHVLYGSFPFELPVAESILLSGPVAGISSQEMVFEVFDEGYTVQLKSSDSAEPQTFRFETAGDFLLDAAFTEVEATEGSDVVIVD